MSYPKYPIGTLVSPECFSPYYKYGVITESFLKDTDNEYTLMLLTSDFKIAGTGTHFPESKLKSVGMFPLIWTKIQMDLKMDM